MVTIVMLACVAVGTALLWASTTLPSPWNAVLSAVATVIITIGVVNLISDLFLQKSISEDLMNLVQTDAAVIAAGIEGIYEVSLTHWDEIFGKSRTIVIACFDTEMFRATVWPRLVKAAKKSSRDIELIFPGTSSPEVLHAVSARMNSTASEYAPALHKLERDLERDWTSLKERSAGSRLTMRRANGSIPYQFFLTDTKAGLILEPIARASGHIEPQVIQFTRSRGGQPAASWLTDSINSVLEDATAPRYTDRSNDAEETL